jgi:hypothetical protein
MFTVAPPLPLSLFLPSMTSLLSTVNLPTDTSLYNLKVVKFEEVFLYITSLHNIKVVKFRGAYLD